MKKFTKILSYVAVIALGVGFFYGMTHAQFQAGMTTVGWDIWWLGAAGWATQGGNIIGVIKTFINWVLGFLSLIALIVLLQH